MIDFMTVLTYLFGILAAMSALLLGLSLLKEQRKKYPILATLKAKQPLLINAILVCLVASYGASLRKGPSSLKVGLELSQGPHGGLTQKATVATLQGELKGT